MKDINQTGMKKITMMVWGIVVCVFVINILLGLGLQKLTERKKALVTPTPTVHVIPQVSYKGVEGKDALTLLKEKSSVTQNSSGLVTSINGYQARDKEHEYWAFYINKKLATVGPADYQTQEGDMFEWKIEKY